MAREQVHLSVPAKLNLTLSVGEPLQNGMHPIVSKMVRIDMCDELEVTRLEEGAWSRYAVMWQDDAPIQSEIDWPITSDLAVLAHRALETLVGHPLPVQMKLEKRIPVGGGLGGGSADAAAMLLATSRLFRLDISQEKIAKELGSDVPFFLNGGHATVSGIGENIAPLAIDQMHFVVILPEYGCNTEQVYKAFDVLQKENVVHGNDLLLPACTVQLQLCKDMKAVKNFTQKEVHLSGSGSTFFIICDTTEHAKTLALQITKKTGLVAIATQSCEEHWR